MADTNEGEAVKRTRSEDEEGHEDSQAKRVKVDDKAQAQIAEVQELAHVETLDSADGADQSNAQGAQVDASADAIKSQSSQNVVAQIGDASQFASDGSSQAETDQFAQQASAQCQEQYAAHYAAQQAFTAPVVAAPVAPAAKKGKTTGLSSCCSLSFSSLNFQNRIGIRSVRIYFQFHIP
jgi:hypothetical protein